MRAKPLMLALVLSSLALPAHAAVEVTFTNPEKYTDMKLGAGPAAKERETVMRELRAWLQKLGDKTLPQGDTLRIEVLDINLAGRDQPWNVHNPDMKLMDEVNWPSIKLRYALLRDGQTVAEAEEVVNDKDYLDRSRMASGSDRLYYEKRMLSDWFAARFGQQTLR